MLIFGALPSMTKNVCPSVLKQRQRVVTGARVVEGKEERRGVSCCLNSTAISKMVLALVRSNLRD